MTIGVDEVLDVVLSTLPDRDRLRLAEDDEPGGSGESGEERLHYSDAGDVAHHVVDLVLEGRLAELSALFAALERLHVEGDERVRVLATIGYLEGVQNVAGHRGVDPAVFLPLLGPESARWWRGLDAFWAGAAPGVLPVDGAG